MSGVNKVILIGNLGRDPEIRYAPSGDAVANFSLATSESWKDKNTGEKQEKTEWHRCVAFRKLAEIIGQYVTKGSKIYVEGKLQTRKWQDKDGNDRYTTQIIIDQMQMLDSRGQGGQPSQGGRAPAQATAPAASQQQQPNDGFSDDIPFNNPYKRMEYLLC